MAVIGNLVIGASVNLGPFIQGLKKAEDAMGRLGSVARGIGGAFNGLVGVKSVIAGIVAGAAVHTVADFFKDSALAASAMNEQSSKVGVVFKDSAGVVTAAAKEMADAFGYPKREFLEGASSIGLLAKAAKLSEAEAGRMGVQFAKLGADASSFYDVPVADALTAIRSGLVGEAEPMRRFGVLLIDEAVKAEALKLGLAKVGQEISQGAKVQARASLIAKGLVDAQGDLARTAGSAANQIRSIWGRIENLQADLGAAFQPITDAVLTLVNVGFKELSTSVDENRMSLLEWATDASSAGGQVFEMFEQMGQAVGGIADAFQVLSALTTTFFTEAKKTFEFIINAPENIDRAVAGMVMGKNSYWVARDAAKKKADEDAAANPDKEQKPPFWASEKVTGFFKTVREKAEAIRTAALNAAPSVDGLGKALDGAGQQAAMATEKVMTLEADLRANIATFGKAADAVSVYKLKMAGANDEQLKNVVALATQHTALLTMADAMTPVDKFTKKMGEIRKLAEEGALSQKDFAKAARHAQEEVAKSTVDSLLTPMEHYQQKIIDLKKLLDAGAISQLAFDRGTKAAARERDAGSETKLAGAMKMGSTEARSTILNFERRSSGDTQQDLAKISREQLNVQNRMLQAINRLGNGVNGAPANAFPPQFNF
jgi:hypothetical protein